MSTIDSSKKTQIKAELLRYRGAELRPTVASAAEAFKVTESWVYRIVASEGLEDCISTADQNFLSEWIDSDEAAELEAEDYPRIIRTVVRGDISPDAHMHSLGSTPMHHWEFQLDEDTFFSCNVDTNGVAFKSVVAGELVEKTSRNWQYILIELAKADLRGENAGWVFGNRKVHRHDGYEDGGMFEYETDWDKSSSYRYASALIGRGVSEGMAKLMDSDGEYRVRRRNWAEDSRGMTWSDGVSEDRFDFFIKEGVRHNSKASDSYSKLNEDLDGTFRWNIESGRLTFFVEIGDKRADGVSIGATFTVDDVYDWMDPDQPQK